MEINIEILNCIKSLQKEIADLKIKQSESNEIIEQLIN